jgi:3-oxoacyl-[acyl-carrier protein] reductase
VLQALALDFFCFSQLVLVGGRRVEMAELFDLQGKTAIVTGGSQGIGKEIALTLAKQGASVVVNYCSNKEKADEVVSQIESGAAGAAAAAAHGKAIAVQGDVSSESAVKALFDKAEETFGKVHIVVNAAGMILTSYPPLAKTPLEEWERIFAVNTRGAFLVSKEAANRIPAGGGGRIVNITTTIVATSMPGYGAYAASKAAVESFTKVLAKELRGTKITANCVAPGAVATDFFYRGKSEEMIKTQTMAPPLERLGKPQDIAPVVLLVVSPQGEWLNGQVIRANGGIAAWEAKLHLESSF